MRYTKSCTAMTEGNLNATLYKGGGVIPPVASTAALPAEMVAVAVPVPQRGAKSGPWDSTMTDSDGVSMLRAITPQEAGGSSGAGLGLLLMMRAELQDLNRTSRPPWEGVSTAGRPGFLPAQPCHKEPIPAEVPQHVRLSSVGALSGPPQQAAVAEQGQGASPCLGEAVEQVPRERPGSHRIAEC